MSKELTNSTEILVHQVIFELWIKTVKICDTIKGNESHVGNIQF